MTQALAPHMPVRHAARDSLQPPDGRKLQPQHFAFMRALAQGLDERASWDRYLRVPGEPADLRRMRKTIAWLRDEFAAAARRERRPGTARLIQLNPDRIATASAVPSLAEFAQQRGLDEFSEAEQVEAFEAEYPPEAAAVRRQRPGESRRARIIALQLEAIQWLQDLTAQAPRPDDSVAAWLHPALAGRLETGGLQTLGSLRAHIDGAGVRWWQHLPGIGAVKAARIADWLVDHAATLATAAKGEGEAHNAARPPAAGIVPFEQFVPPPPLDGSAGRNRAPQARCLLQAMNDTQAVGAWLASKGAGAPQARLSATQRSYRKEAERLLLWAVLERGKPMSSIDAADVGAFCAFLDNPPLHWRAPRHRPRASRLWRPLEGPLSAAALRQSMIILRSLFAFLVASRYVLANPFADVALPQDRQRATSANRCFSGAQWTHIAAALASRTGTAAGRRLQRGMHWICETGLGLSELIHARCGDLVPSASAGRGEQAPGGEWHLVVRGRGGRSRRVAVPSLLVDALARELAGHGLAPEVDAVGNRHVPVLGRLAVGAGGPEPWSTSGLYQAVKAFLAEAADTLASGDAAHLRAASTQWLRRTHRSRADPAGHR